MVVGVQTQQRRATAAAWSASGKILADGELGVATDTKILKIGDGVNEWDDLPVAFQAYYLSAGGTAVNSDLLGGISSTGFVKTADATTAATPSKVALRFSDGRLKAATGLSTDDVVNVAQMVTADTNAIAAAQQVLVSRVETANFTLALTDTNKLILANNANYTPNITCTVPANATVAFPIGTFVDIFTADKGPVAITPAAGVTVYGQSLLHGGGSSLRLLKTDVNGWLVVRIQQSPGPVLRRKIKTGSDNTLASGSFVPLRLDGTDSGTAFYSNNVDTLGANQQWSSAQNTRAYCRRSGYYQINAQISLLGAPAGRFYVQIRVNGINQDLGGGKPRGSQAQVSANFNATIGLNAGDYIEVLGFQDGVASDTVSESSFASSVLEWAWLRSL